MIVVVMGVTGCGKTTLGIEIGKRLNLPFYDADDYHPPANKEKLRHNIPLDDADRQPWLQILAENIAQWEKNGGGVLACSALKEKYRAVLRTGAPNLRIVYIKGTKAEFTERLKIRAAKGHDLIKKDFDKILDGQFRDLEEPADAIVIPASLPPEAMAGLAVSQLAS